LILLFLVVIAIGGATLFIYFLVRYAYPSEEPKPEPKLVTHGQFPQGLID